MNPHKKGWLNNYFLTINKLKNPENIYSGFSQLLESDISEVEFYRKIQPTGLLYGHPLSFPFVEVKKTYNWDENAKMKVLLLESFIYSAAFFHDQNSITISNSNDIKDFFHFSVTRLKDFYHEYCPVLLFTKPKFLRTGGDLSYSEFILDQRVTLKGKSKSYWKSFFHNSLLFIDVLFYGKWFNLNFSSQKNENQLHQEKEYVRYYLLKVMAAAASANAVIEKEEKLMFEYFLHSASLSKEKEKEAMEFLNDGLHVEDIEPLKMDFWILKKYILEIAILIAWSDKAIDEEEKIFLQSLGQKLGFNEQEIEQSVLAIEGFVVSHWEDVHFLQKKHSFYLIRDRFVRHVSKLITINKDRIVQEIQESRELMYLLRESKKRSLTELEKEKVRLQIFDILKTIPTFVIIALPGTFITLPLLLRLLPKSAFPTAWHD